MDPDQPQVPHFMPGGQGFATKQQYEDEQAKQDLKMSKYIKEMDKELQDRFKALKTIQDFVHEMDEDEQKEIRKLEIVFEQKYKEIYAMREKIINGKESLPEDLISLFDERAVKMKDEDSEKVETEPCDVKGIQNSPLGVCDFWSKAILNHNIGPMVTEKDRPILGYLINIELDLHSEELGEGYDLIFTFTPNSYFDGTVIRKQQFQKTKGVLDKTTSTPIKWKANCNPTMQKKKKKRQGKKVNVEVQIESFFNIFNTLDPESESEKEKEKKKPEKDDKDGEDEYDEDDINGKLQLDLDTADLFKDDLVPLALEYYLNVIEKENEEDDDDSDDEGKGDDSDDDKPKKKKKGKKGGATDMPLGPDGKPQDCKQQ